MIKTKKGGNIRRKSCDSAFTFFCHDDLAYSLLIYGHRALRSSPMHSKQLHGYVPSRLALHFLFTENKIQTKKKTNGRQCKSVCYSFPLLFAVFELMECDELNERANFNIILKTNE